MYSELQAAMHRIRKAGDALDWPTELFDLEHELSAAEKWIESEALSTARYKVQGVSRDLTSAFRLLDQLAAQAPDAPPF